MAAEPATAPPLLPPPFTRPPSSNRPRFARALGGPAAWQQAWSEKKNTPTRTETRYGSSAICGAVNRLIGAGFSRTMTATKFIELPESLSQKTPVDGTIHSGFEPGASALRLADFCSKSVGSKSVGSKIRGEPRATGGRPGSRSSGHRTFDGKVTL